ncbi:hypothetical protein BHM03_00017239 [Ensete ventricosum]|nr:hypothetical protein BHM03_00017239 [Ensete ventricosum]
MQFGGVRSPFPLIWRKISIHVELRGVVGGRERLKSGPSILLDGPEAGPRGCSTLGRFYSSRFPAIRVSAAMKWFALCVISGTVVGGFSTKDQNSLDGRMPIKKAWITKEGCASGIARDSMANLLTNWARGSSLPWAMPRSEAAVGFGQELVRKLCSNSLTSWSKEIMDAGWRWSYHIRAGPLKVVGKTRQISASDESYNAICTRKAVTCSDGSELPSYVSKTGNLKLAGTGLSRISRAKGDLCLEFSAASSFDLVTSFCTSSRRSFIRWSCIRNELVESDDKVSGSYGACSIPRCGAVDFFGTIDGVSDRVSGGFGSIGPGRAGAGRS